MLFMYEYIYLLMSIFSLTFLILINLTFEKLLHRSEHIFSVSLLSLENFRITELAPLPHIVKLV